MNVLPIIFYFFAAVAIIAAFMVVTFKNPVHGVLSLVLAFFAMSGIWILLDAEFLALILVLVYVGAVMTLFLFVVMMLNIDWAGKREGFVRYLPFAAVIVLMMVAIIITVIGPKQFGLTHVPTPAVMPADYSNTVDLGSVLYTNYAYPFEVAGTILLAAIIAAIILSHHAPKNRKVQIISKQIDIKRDQFVRLVDLPSEKKNPAANGGQP